MPWAQSQTSMPHALERTAEVARERKKEKFISLIHHISVDLLEDVFYELHVGRPFGSGPADVEYITRQTLERNLERMYNRVQRGAYRAPPSGGSTYPSRTAGNARSRFGPGGHGRPRAVVASERDLREGPRHLVRVPAWAQHARSAGCALRRNSQQEGELHTGPDSIVLRHGEPGMLIGSWSIGSATGASSA